MTRTFPILLDYRERRDHPEWPRAVPWEFAETCRAQAEYNHGQTLERLAERGGLGMSELLVALEGRDYRAVREFTEEAAAPLVIAKLAAWLARHDKPAAKPKETIR